MLYQFPLITDLFQHEKFANGAEGSGEWQSVFPPAEGKGAGRVGNLTTALANQPKKTTNFGATNLSEEELPELVRRMFQWQRAWEAWEKNVDDLVGELKKKQEEIKTENAERQRKRVEREEAREARAKERETRRAEREARAKEREARRAEREARAKAESAEQQQEGTGGASLEPQENPPAFLEEELSDEEDCDFLEKTPDNDDLTELPLPDLPTRDDFAALGRYNLFPPSFETLPAEVFPENWTVLDDVFKGFSSSSSPGGGGPSSPPSITVLLSNIVSASKNCDLNCPKYRVSLKPAAKGFEDHKQSRAFVTVSGQFLRRWQANLLEVKGLDDQEALVTAGGVTAGEMVEEVTS